MDAGKCFHRQSSEMRSEDHIEATGEQVLGRIGWFGVPHVQACSSDGAIVEGLSEVAFDDEAAATDIDDDEPGTSSSESSGIDDPCSFGVQRGGQDERIGFSKEAFEWHVGELGLSNFGSAIRCHREHSESPGSDGHGSPDCSCTEDSKSLAFKSANAVEVRVQSEVPASFGRSSGHGRESAPRS